MPERGKGGQRHLKNAIIELFWGFNVNDLYRITVTLSLLHSLELIERTSLSNSKMALPAVGSLTVVRL